MPLSLSAKSKNTWTKGNLKNATFKEPIYKEVDLKITLNYKDIKLVQVL